MLTSERFIDRAKTALGAGQIGPALHDARRAVAFAPSSPVATTVLGVVYAKTGSEDGARMAYRWAIPASGGAEPKAYSNLARLEEISGRYDVAETIYQSGITQNPKADVLIERLAALHISRRDWTSAAACLGGLLKGQPIAESLAELCGLVASQVDSRRDPNLVVKLIDLACSTPNRMIPKALSVHARIAKTTTPDLTKRLDVYRRALVFNPAEAVAILESVQIMIDKKAKLKAAAWYCQYAVLRPDDMENFRRAGQIAFEVRWPWRCIGRALVLHEKHPNDANLPEILQEMFSQFKTEEELPYAKAWALSVLERDYEDPRFWDAALRTLHNLAFHEESDPHWDKAIQKFPGIPAVQHNRALFLQDRGLSSRSGAYAKRSVLLAPDYQRGYNLVAMYLNSEHRLDEAIRLGSRYMKINEAKSAYWMNYGTFHRASRDFPGAIRAFQTALMHDPDYAEAEFNIAITSMMTGELHEAFRAYERRWAIPTFPSPVRRFSKKIWRGRYVHQDVSLLIYMEQGMGDEVMFSWYLPFVIKDAARVMLDCDERLVGIMKRTYPEIECVPRSIEGDPRAHDPAWTHKAPIGHLPQHYVPEVKELIRKNWDLYCKRGERHPPRLVVDPERLELWRKRLKDRFGDKPVVGVSWRSSLHTPIRDGQYVSIPEVAKSLGSDVGVINLQYSFTEEEHETFKALGDEHGFDFHTPREIDLKDDLEDIFAILQLCDACVTPLISLAWMGGAVGTPTWVFRTAAEQRTFHMLGAPFITWAPSIKLFFRRPGLPWDEVVEAIGETVAHLAKTGEARDVVDPKSIPMASTWLT